MWQDNSCRACDRTTFCFFSNLIHFYFFFLHSQFYNFLYMFRTGWSIIRRIKLHVQPLAPFPHSLLSRAWPLVLTEWPVTTFDMLFIFNKTITFDIFCMSCVSSSICNTTGDMLWLISKLMHKNSYLFTYNTFIKILYMFWALPCSHLQEVYIVIVYMQPLVSSLSAGDCLVHLS